MIIRFIPRRRQTAWLMGLLLAGLLAACGGASESASNDVVASPTTEQTANTPTTVPPTEEVATTESEPAANENLTDTGQPPVSAGMAMCHPATAQNDPIVAALQPNSLVALATDDEWSKGPADAPVTLIEYGDFQ